MKIASLPRAVDGVVLRYGFSRSHWYRRRRCCGSGPQGRGFDISAKGMPIGRSFTSMTAVAATVASLTAEPGVYNIVDDDPCPCEWLPAFARWVDGPNRRASAWEDALKSPARKRPLPPRSNSGGQQPGQGETWVHARPLLWKPHLARSAIC